MALSDDIMKFLSHPALVRKAMNGLCRDGKLTKTRTNYLFFVAGLPVPQGSKKIVRCGAHPIMVEASKGLMPWRQQVSATARCRAPERPRPGPVEVRLDFFMRAPKTKIPVSCPKRRDAAGLAWPTTRPDIDKLSRGILDALTGIFWEDDSQVVRLIAEKHFAERETGVKIGIEEL